MNHLDNVPHIQWNRLADSWYDGWDFIVCTWNIFVSMLVVIWGFGLKLMSAFSRFSMTIDEAIEKEVWQDSYLSSNKSIQYAYIMHRFWKCQLIVIQCTYLMACVTYVSIFIFSCWHMLAQRAFCKVVVYFAWSWPSNESDNFFNGRILRTLFLSWLL